MPLYHLTHHMACTATVTRDLYKEVIEILEITGCVNICLSPDRCNIFYEVKPRISIESDFSELLDSLHKHQNSTPRAIIYCQSLDMCSNYLHSILHLQFAFILNAFFFTCFCPFFSFADINKNVIYYKVNIGNKN